MGAREDLRDHPAHRRADHVRGVDLEVVDDRIADFRLAGDFFLEPDDALALIDRAVTGLPATTDAAGLAAAIRGALPEDAVLLGFTPEAVALLASQVWRVSPQSNRVGLRLAGETSLARAVTGELPSEGTVGGALQVPPSGLPVLFLADHPVTGGYPVIAVVVSADLDRAAQLPPGSTVRFLVADP